MTRRLIGFALRLYPRSWREIHGDELALLTEDLLDDPAERPWRVAVDTAIGALREQARPRYLGTGRLVGLTVAAAVVAVAGLGLTDLVDRGPGIDLIPVSAPSSGRLATFAGMEKLLVAQHVRVTVNGVTVAVPEIASRSVGFEQGAAVHLERTLLAAAAQRGPVVGPLAMPVFRFSPIVAVHRAVAYQVLTTLLVDRAEQHGAVVSVSTARAFAEKEYRAWQSHPVTLPPGMGRPVFLSAVAVAAYRQGLTINREMAAVAGTPGAGSRTPALRRWMAGQLARDSVVIDGIPGLTAGTLAANLPPHL